MIMHRIVCNLESPWCRPWHPRLARQRFCMCILPMDTTIRSAGGAARPTRHAQPTFGDLNVHSASSLLEGAIAIAKLAKLATALGFPAVGLSDTNNLFGALEFS